MKFITTLIFVCAINLTRIYPIKPELMYLFKDSWKTNIEIFEKDDYSYHDKQHLAELEKFVKSYEDLAHAVYFLEITTMPVSWQNVLLEAKKYLNATAQYYELVLFVLRDPTIAFQRPQNTIHLIPYNYMQLNTVKAQIGRVNALLKNLV